MSFAFSYCLPNVCHSSLHALQHRHCCASSSTCIAQTCACQTQCIVIGFLMGMPHEGSWSWPPLQTPYRPWACHRLIMWAWMQMGNKMWLQPREGASEGVRLSSHPTMLRLNHSPGLSVIVWVDSEACSHNADGAHGMEMAWMLQVWRCGWCTWGWCEWHGCCRCEWCRCKCGWCKGHGYKGCQCGLRGYGVWMQVHASMGIDGPGGMVDGARGTIHLAWGRLGCVSCGGVRNMSAGVGEWVSIWFIIHSFSGKLTSWWNCGCARGCRCRAGWNTCLWVCI